MNSLMLRKASPGDSQFAFLAKRAAFKEYVEKLWGWDEAEQLRLHQQRFGTQDFRIINVSGVDVGVLALVVEPDSVKVNQVFILPEYQGKGIGRTCVLLIMKEVQHLQLPVRLQVLKINPRALAFYQRLRFVYIGETETHILLEAKNLPTQSGHNLVE